MALEAEGRIGLASLGIRECIDLSVSPIDEVEGGKAASLVVSSTRLLSNIW